MIVRRPFKQYVAKVHDMPLNELFTHLIEATQSSGKLARFFLAKFFLLFRWPSELRRVVRVGEGCCMMGKHEAVSYENGWQRDTLVRRSNGV